MLRFNENNEVLTTEQYRAILVGLQLREDISYAMEELAGLAEAAGAEVLGRMVQTLERPNTATWIGKGKVAELAEMAAAMDADVVIAGDELTGMQMRNLEDAVGVRVIDRTILILDLFAARALSREGKLQVELAQLQYRLPRLTGFGRSLSRLGGGIGTRGPGEKKLETDRRHIERRIDDIRAELRDLVRTRDVQRARREKQEIPVVALVGYTNAGKSALMNRLLAMTDKSDKAVTERDMLFATLDAQSRSIVLDDRRQFILVDTVGFVSRLPHTLVKAFRATLEEVRCADLLLHVVDAAYPDHDFHVAVTEQVLAEIGAGDKPRVLVYNKVDLEPGVLPAAPDTPQVFVSARTGQGMETLLKTIADQIFADQVRTRLRIPYTRGEVTSYLCEQAVVYEMTYEADGVVMDLALRPEDHQRYRAYEIV